MKALIDSGIWWRRYHGLPLNPSLEKALENVTEWYLSPLSVMEMLFKWRHKRHLLPVPDPKEWLERSLQGYRPALMNYDVSMQAGLWDWRHGDMVDRSLAAWAKVEGVSLFHTDKKLKDLPGFPQKYFPNLENPSGQPSA